MAEGISAVLTQFETLLAAAAGSGTGAGLTIVPPNLSLDDLPTSNLHRYFEVTLGWGPTTTSLHGTTRVENEAQVIVALHHDPRMNRATASKTIGTDREVVKWVLSRPSNYATATTGLIHVKPDGVCFQEPTPLGPNVLQSVGRFIARWRMTQDHS